MFGKFKSIEDFIASYVVENEQQKMDYVNSLPFDQRAVELSNLVTADVAELKATIKQRQPDDTSSPKHYQMIITVDELIKSSPDIKSDILECEKDKSPVFLAIRFGDTEGLTQPITKGMNNGDLLHLQGQWIPKDKAYSHGGEKMSVLHFTHHPVGFTCTAQKCYS